MRLFLPIAAAAIAAIQAAAQTDTVSYANTIGVDPGAGREALAAAAAHVIPTPAQLAALDDGYIAFIHFGPNTFSRREWGTGTEDPTLFNPSGLDTDQWVKAMKDAGMKKVVLTTKHHDGYVIWNSRYTDHGIMSSPFQGGKGDIMRDLAESCRKYGLKLGVYLSPADLYQIENPAGLYGNLSPKTTRTIPRPVEGRPFKSDVTFTFDGIDDYNEYFLNQLYELLTEYGPIHEVWFDGAHPKSKGGQTYNYAAWKELIRTLAPEAVIFGREDIRWGGNEAGHTRYAERNVIPYTQNPDTATVFPDMTADDIGSLAALAGAPYLHYQPAEIDTSIREGWFYRDEEVQKSRSADDIFDIYERSVGGNSIFILNIPPDRSGRFSQRDVDALAEAGRRIAETYGTDLLAASPDRSGLIADNDIHTFVEVSEPLVVTLPEPVVINRIALREPVADRGERIDSIAADVWADGKWVTVATAPNVGFRRILRFPEVTTDRIRIRVEDSRLEPYIADLSAHHYMERPASLAARRTPCGKIAIAPARDGFSWKGSPEARKLAPGTEIRYTTDGTVPGGSSALYTGPFKADNVVVKAVATLNGMTGPVMEQRFGYVKKPWRMLGATSAAQGHPASAAFDNDASTSWRSDGEATPTLAIDLGALLPVTGVIYTPERSGADGKMARARIETSADGASWTEAGVWDLGNLINDPAPREYILPAPVEARYVRVTTLSTTSGTPVSAIAELDIF